MWPPERLITAAVLGVASAVMLFPLVMEWTGREVELVQNLGFSPGERAPAAAWAAGLAFAAVYIIYAFWAVPEVWMGQQEVSWFKLVGVLAAFASGVMEEVVFRRWLMDAAMAQGVGDLGQVAISAVVFGVAHLFWHGFNFDWRFSAAAVASTTVAGAALAGIYLLGGRNLGPCIASHTLINLVVEPWLVLAAVSRLRRAGRRGDALG
jgi:hypothetical protein